MPRFFCSQMTQTGGSIVGEDAKHIAKSLRLKVGEDVVVCNGTGTDYHCKILAIDEKLVELATLSWEASTTEAPVQITLYQALPKGDKLDLIVQKAVELGAMEIAPVLTKYCVSRPDEKSMKKKQERLQKIALEAAKQSGRSMIPTVKPLLTLPQALQEMKEKETSILFYEHATAPLGQVLQSRPTTLGVLIGSEGGFAEEEVALALEHGLDICTMGPRILRCETASFYALSAITYQYENT